MGRATILTCAVTGNITTRENHPGLPITPKEIATAAIDANKAGAAIIHVHARDPNTGKGSREVGYFREIQSRIRDAGCDAILNFSTGEGGRFIPSGDDPKVAAAGSTLCRPEQRVLHVEELRPELCTLDFNTMWSGSAVVINTPKNLEIMASHIQQAGVLPEIEIFDGGDLHMCKYFLEKGLLKPNVIFQFVLGVRFGASANSETMLFLKSQLPPGAIWGAFGIGRASFPMLCQSWLLGGHVRVGLEDNVYIRAGELTRDNAELVEKGVTLVEQLGGSIVGPGEARTILGLV